MGMISGSERVGSIFGPFSSCNPLLTLQGAGVYYLTAARCSQERKSRFDVFQQAGSFSNDADPESTRSAVCAIVDREKTIDHNQIILSQLTKAYEVFKKTSQQRMTLYVAYEIATAHQRSGKHDIAVRFYERICKSYRKENWKTLLFNVCRQSYNSAEQLNQSQIMCETLVEQMCSEDLDELKTIYSQLAAVCAASTSKLSVDMDQITGFFNYTITFKSPQAHVHGNVDWQLRVNCSRYIPTMCRIKRIRVMFSNPLFDMTLHNDAPFTSEMLVNFYSAEKETLPNYNISISENKRGTTVFQRTEIPKSSQDLSITCVIFTLGLGNCELDLVSAVKAADNATVGWLANDMTWTTLPLITQIKIGEREPQVQFDIETPVGLYLDEHVMVSATAQNLEAEKVRLIVAFKFKSIAQKSSIFFQGHECQTLHIDFGDVDAGQSCTRQFEIMCSSCSAPVVLESTAFLSFASGNGPIVHISPVLLDLTDRSWLEKTVSTSTIAFDPPFKIQSQLIRKPTPALKDVDLLADPGFTSTARTDSWMHRVIVESQCKKSVFVKSVDILSVASAAVHYPLMQNRVVVTPVPIPDCSNEWSPKDSRTYVHMMETRSDLFAPVSVSPGELQVEWSRYILLI